MKSIQMNTVVHSSFLYVFFLCVSFSLFAQIQWNRTKLKDQKTPNETRNRQCKRRMKIKYATWPIGFSLVYGSVLFRRVFMRLCAVFVRRLIRCWRWLSAHLIWYLWLFYAFSLRSHSLERKTCDFLPIYTQTQEQPKLIR